MVFCHRVVFVVTDSDLFCEWILSRLVFNIYTNICFSILFLVAATMLNTGR